MDFGLNETQLAEYLTRQQIRDTGMGCRTRIHRQRRVGPVRYEGMECSDRISPKHQAWAIIC
ncbi:MAG: hypothetical protein ACLR8Y_15580 [Alistipes indistinctus]